MNIKKILHLTLLFYASSVAAQTKPTSSMVQRPKLVVGIVVDQMRWDFLYRYYERYGNGGFKRMLREGFSAENAQISYIPTFTACGHASIYTGSVPSINGIAGNEWIVQETGKKVYCVQDTLSTSVGSISAAGQMSPRNMLSSTVGDELKLATNYRSKVIGIALKDRGGILPAGHSANAAYWFDDSNGSWISSTFYMNDLPAWVKAFNSQNLIEKYLTKEWNTLYPIASYVQSSPDNNQYEGKFKDEQTTSFPHKIPYVKGSDFNSIRNTPFANTLTTDFAMTAIKNEELGKDAITDMLAVSYSSTDYIGHQFGPNSVEVEDTYLRLDKDLENFFNFLDKEVGKGQFTVFLSADHGAAHNPTLLTDHKIPAGYWSSENHRKGLNSYLEKKYNVKEVVAAIQNYQVSFNNLALSNSKINRAELRSDCVDYLSKQEGVSYVLDMSNLDRNPIPTDIRERAINGYNYKRSGEVQIFLNPGWYQGYGKTGTTHGTWNPYDAHIPVVFMGWGIKAGSTNRQVYMTDIAPTISALLHIQAPNGNIGKPITEILE